MQGTRHIKHFVAFLMRGLMTIPELPVQAGAHDYIGAAILCLVHGQLGYDNARQSVIGAWHAVLLILPPFVWAAWYITRLLVILTPKGVVLFFLFCLACRVPELAVQAGGHDAVDVEGAHRVADVGGVHDCLDQQHPVFFFLQQEGPCSHAHTHPPSRGKRKDKRKDR